MGVGQGVCTIDDDDDLPLLSVGDVTVTEGGTAVVLSAGEFKILSTIPMGESPVRSTVAVAGQHLYLRTARNLYCLGQAKGG